MTKTRNSLPGCEEAGTANRTRQRERRGAAAAEFAFVAPLLLLLFFGMIEYGRMIMVYQTLTNASREGARLAVLDGTTQQDVENTVVAYMGNAFITIPQENVSVSPDPTTAVFGDEITVGVSVDFADVSWLPVAKFLANTELEASTVMRRESPQ